MKKTVDNLELKLQYEGSVKNVYSPKDKDETLWFSFTDKYSVFDWGKMPDLIANKGNALALIGTYIFQKLSQTDFWEKLPSSSHLKKFNAALLQKHFTHPVFSSLKENGLPSHFQALYSKAEGQKFHCLTSKEESNKDLAYLRDLNLKNQLFMQVLAADVGWPESKIISNEAVYFYPPADTSGSRPRLIPLELVFSFGLLEGSSLKNKLDKDPQYADTLGLSAAPKVNQWFAQPILQFFTKLEPKDRLLSRQEAALMAGLTGEQFEELIELTLDTALALHVLFAEHKLELWDGKLEFIFVPNKKQILLADCVGPDEIRLLYNNIHLSKEILRRYYRPTSWYKSLSVARSIAAKNGNKDWQQICLDELKQSPSPLPPHLKAVVNHLYGMLANEITGEPIFSSHPDLKEFVSKLSTINTQEPVNA